MSNALELFTSVPRKYNCAQSIAAGFGRLDMVEELSTCGGGRAPEGTCGALYAALKLAPESARADLASKFAAATCSTKCREIKEKGVPCTKCVELAEALLNIALDSKM